MLGLFDWIYMIVSPNTLKIKMKIKYNKINAKIIKLDSIEH